MDQHDELLSPPLYPRGRRQLGRARELRARDGRDLAIDVDGEAVGALGFRRLNDLGTRTAEIGYWLGQAFWGRGITTAAMKLATPVAFAQYDFVRLQAGVISWNPASARVLSKAGYEHEATLRRAIYRDGQVCDRFVYAMLRD